MKTAISPLRELNFLDALMASADLPATAKAVGYWLVRWTNGNEAHRFNGYCWATREQIAKQIGKSVDAVTDATKALTAGGWFAAKRRRNSSSLIQPNWSRADQEKPAELQEVAKMPFPEEAKMPAYSADLDRADQDSEVKQHTPDAVATGVRALDLEVQSPNEYDQPKAPYLQSRKAANHAWFELQQMPFPRFGIGDDFELNERSDRGAEFHWLRILRSGHSAADILTAAESYLRDCPKQQRPSVGGFLARFENYTDEDDRPDVVIAGPQTIFDLANEFEQRVRASEALQVAA